jgi:hypothetical protein
LISYLYSPPSPAVHQIQSAKFVLLKKWRVNCPPLLNLYFAANRQAAGGATPSDRDSDNSICEDKPGGGRGKDKDISKEEKSGGEDGPLGKTNCRGEEEDGMWGWK